MPPGDGNVKDPGTPGMKGPKLGTIEVTSYPEDPSIVGKDRKYQYSPNIDKGDDVSFELSNSNPNTLARNVRKI